MVFSIISTKCILSTFYCYVNARLHAVSEPFSLIELNSAKDMSVPFLPKECSLRAAGMQLITVLACLVMAVLLYISCECTPTVRYIQGVIGEPFLLFTLQHSSYTAEFIICILKVCTLVPFIIISSEGLEVV